MLKMKTMQYLNFEAGNMKLKEEGCRWRSTKLDMQCVMTVSGTGIV